MSNSESGSEYQSPCQCSGPGYCPVHKRKISETRWNQCKTRPGYFVALSDTTHNRSSQPRLSQPADYLAEGPGEELKNILQARGIRSCEVGCDETAIKMNELGADGCREKLDELVEEILPRARQWVRKNYKGSRLIPRFAKDPVIRLNLRSVILQAIEQFERR